MSDAISWRMRMTIESGIQCVATFHEFHLEAERLLGHPIWTHEFAMEETYEDLRIALLAENEGLSFHVERKLGPVDTLLAMMPDKPVIAIDSSTGAVWRADRDRRPRVGP